MDSEIKVKMDPKRRFFHVIANGRQRRNALDCITVNGIKFDEAGDVLEKVMNHFRKAYNELWVERPTFVEFSGSIISEEDNELLSKEFSQEEVWEAVKGCDGNKALGPDGFNLFAIKKCWKIIKDDFV